MEVEEIVGTLEKRLQLLCAEEFVAGPVHAVAIPVAKQAVHVELEVALLDRQCLLVGADQGETAALERAPPGKEVEEKLFDRMDAADLVAMDAAEEHDPRPLCWRRDAYDAINRWISRDVHESAHRYGCRLGDIVRRHRLLLDHPAPMALGDSSKFSLPDVFHNPDNGRVVGRKPFGNSLELVGREAEISTGRHRDSSPHT